MTEREPSDHEPEPAGAERTGDSFFARRGWMLAVAVGLVVAGTWLAGILGFLVAALIAAAFLAIASR